jgi:MFS family permease
MSEMYGRLPLYHACNILFVVFNICCATSKTLGALVAFRFLAGSVGSAPLTLGGGTIADLISREQRATAMSVWVLGPSKFIFLVHQIPDCVIVV